MPKKPPTPPPPSDVPQLLCIVRPYPDRPAYDFEGHSSAEIMLVQWLSCFIKRDSIFTLYWRPKDDNVFVEVKREPHNFYNNILGRHYWAQFLVDCPPTGKNKSTDIFYCGFGNDHDAQKLGWRQKDISEEWFDEDYSELFVDPYPPPTYVQKTAEYCLNIPKPKPVVAPRLVVGTEQYYAQASSSPGSASPATSEGQSKKPKNNKRKKKASNALPFV